MAIKRRQNKLQDLASRGIIVNNVSGSLPFEYSGPNSPLFTISEIPNPAPQGKSSFLIAGTELLKNSIEVKIELIDSEGGVIYTEPVANYLEGNARRVSIEVYDDTPAGPANLFILAQVDPEEWEDETGTDVTNFPNPSPKRNKGIRRKKKRRKERSKKKQMRGMPTFDFGGMSAGRMVINPFAPPPGNDTRFRRRRGRRRRGQTTDISDQYNFLQKVEMQIVPTATNTEKILFYQEPRIRVFEAFKPFVSNLAQTGSIVVSGSAEAQVINNTQTAGATSATDSFGQGLSAFRRKRKFKKFAGKGGLSKRKRITRRASPEVDNYSISSDSFTFTSKHVGGKLILDNPSVNTTQFPASRFTVPTTGSFEIIKVNNSSTIIPDKSFQVFDNQLQQHVDAPITHTSFSLEFDPEVTRSISVTNFRSYADVRVSNIRTFSGDVFRTKIYRKSEESIGDYELFADLPLESSELLLNANEGTGLERTGYFVSQEDVGKFWHVSQSLVGVAGATSASVAAYDIDKQMDSVYISGSNREVNQYVQFKLRDAYKFQLEKNVGYDFSANIYGQATPKVIVTRDGTEVKQLAELEVYISGSNIPAQQGNELFGAKLGVLRINDGSTEKDFRLTTGDFESTAVSPGCNLIFKINAGKFYISDISVRPATETGFSPDLFTFQAPMPSNETRPETYEFIAEFYDVNNNQADAFCFTPSGSTFQGSNMVITGQDNVLESNLFIGGETTASGMHLGGVSSVLPETGTDGAAGSGFMRSVGYTGFTSASNDELGGTAGFMIYSGSVLPDSGDDYNGVGMELISKSGSLRFSTNPSRFEVKADAFFVGKTHLESATGVGQFISGAQGNVEISSSNFHLTRDGDVTMQGTITATAGNIGGFTIFGAPVTPAIASPDKSLILSGSGQITGSSVLFTGGVIGGFALNNNAISSSNNLLRLKSSGQITGSNVLFDGGQIGGLTISGDNLSAGTSYRLSSSVDLTDPVSFISSSNFKVSAGGNITGSSVLFTGGTVGGFTINDSTIQGGNLILDKNGTVRSANYVSDFAGWKISAEENGFAEFENVKIRGTLSTTTFEKESVNAVGGQLFVANSTAITGSSVAAAATTMSVVNASGFQTGEVIIAKKITNTGFTTEYISVDSASLDGDLTKDELHGRLYVTRSIASSFPAGTDSGSVGDSGGTAQDYEPGQVLASTGRIGTGYIRINANPNTLATPYIDIVERTGSAPYDVELKTRIGDLSGLAGTRNVPLKNADGSNFTGFGIMSEVAFLSGSNVKLETPRFLLGDRNSTFVSGSNGKIEVSSSAFHLKNDGQLLFGDKNANKYIEWDNSNLVVRGDLTVDNIRTPAIINGNPSTLVNASSSITSDGFAKFASASIAGFDISPIAIQSTQSLLVLRASGSITASNADVKGDIKATTGFLQDIEVSGLRIAPANETTEFRHDTTSSPDSENFGPRSSSLGNVNDNVATGKPYAIENWWSGVDTDNVHDPSVYRLIPNGTTRPYKDFSNWGWKFKVIDGGGIGDLGTLIDNEATTTGPAYELLESKHATNWPTFNPNGFSFSWGHTLAAPGYNGPLDENKDIVSNVGRAFYPSDRYPGPTDPTVWSKPTGVPNVVHRIPPLVGGRGSGLSDPDTRFTGFDNYVQSDFNVHPDSGSSDFSPVFCFYTGSGIINTYLQGPGSTFAAAYSGADHEDNMYFTFISPLMEQSEFTDLGSSIEVHGAPLWTSTDMGDISTSNADTHARYVSTEDLKMQLLIVERVFTGAGYTSTVRGKVTEVIMPGHNTFQQHTNSSGYFTGFRNPNFYYGWTKLVMNLSETLKSFSSKNSKFNIVIAFKYTHDRFYAMDNGWGNSPDNLKGFAMTELRITKDISTPTTFNFGNVRAADTLIAGRKIEAGNDTSDGFEFKGHYNVPTGSGPASPYFHIDGATLDSKVTIETANRRSGTSLGQITIKDLGLIHMTDSSNNISDMPWSISSAETSHMLRFKGPDNTTNPENVNDYLSFVGQGYSSLTGGPTGSSVVNLVGQGIDFIVHSGQSPTFDYLIRADSSNARVGILTENPSFVLDVTGDIRATANITAYSDIRIKENIRPIENALFKVTQLEGVTYDRKDKDKSDTLKGTQIGLIAQQVEPIVPEIVQIDDKGMYNLNYGNLAGLFVEAIKEQQEQIKELKREIEEIKNGSSR